VADGGWLLVLFAIVVLLDLARKGRKQGQKQRARSSTSLPERTSALAAWRRALEDAGPIGRHADRSLESAEEVEEGRSLEVESRDTAVTRAPRAVVDLDDESRLAVVRRRDAAAMRNRPRRLADHEQFDATVRQAAPPPPERPRSRRDRLREAIKWREILDRPVGWRDEE